MKTLADFPSDTPLLIVNGEWDESQHPRDEAGKFTDGGGSGGTPEEFAKKFTGGVSGTPEEFMNKGSSAFEKGIGRAFPPAHFTGEQRKQWEKGWDRAARKDLSRFK